MKRLLAAILAVSLSVVVFAQTTPDPETKPAPPLDANVLIAKVDALNHILPLLLTKEQAGKIMTALEKVREQEKKVRKNEDDQLRPFLEKLKVAVKRGEEEHLVPDRQLLIDLAKLLRTFDKVREITVDQNVDTLETLLKSTLNAGQIKTLQQSLDPRFFAPDIKIEEVSDSQRTRLFVRAILLQPAAYDVLVALSKK